jgi:hypothetical protein
MEPADVSQEIAARLVAELDHERPATQRRCEQSADSVAQLVREIRAWAEVSRAGDAVRIAALTQSYLHMIEGREINNRWTVIVTPLPVQDIQPMSCSERLGPNSRLRRWEFRLPDETLRLETKQMLDSEDVTEHECLARALAMRLNWLVGSDPPRKLSNS